MSKVMRTIDAKSFIIGVLSAVVVCMAMGARMKSTTYRVGSMVISSGATVGGIPFAVDNNKLFYYHEAPR